MSDFQFAQPGAATWMVLALVAIAAVVMGLLRRRRLLRLVAEEPLLARLAPSLDLSRAWLRALLAAVALSLLVVARMDPRWGMQVEQVQRRGMDTIFVVDVSKSMLATDVTPTRLDRAKQFVIDASEALEGDRIGLVDFAGASTIRIPLTLNYAAFRQAVQELDPKAAPRGGSMIGEGIRKAAASFPVADKGPKAIIVITDGEDSDGSRDSKGSQPVEAAREAFEQRGARVFVVGVGDMREGSRVPVVRRDGQTDFATEPDGPQHWSKMDSTLLDEIARSGGGTFVPAGTAQVDMAAFYRDALGSLDRIDQEASLVKRQTPRFQWFAGAALALLLAESMLTDRRHRRAAS